MSWVLEREIIAAGSLNERGTTLALFARQHGITVQALPEFGVIFAVRQSSFCEFLVAGYRSQRSLRPRYNAFSPVTVQFHKFRRTMSRKCQSRDNAVVMNRIRSLNFLNYESVVQVTGLVLLPRGRSMLAASACVTGFS